LREDGEEAVAAQAVEAAAFVEEAAVVPEFLVLFAKAG
jgi:hypothetical protein